MHITFYQRKPQEANYSIERLFDDVRKSFSSEVQCKVAISSFPSRGFLKRLYNIVEAIFRQGDVNHITGDVHFLTYLLRKRKTILTIHDLVSVERLKGFRKALFLFLWYRLPMRRAAVVTVITESTKKELLNYIKYEPQKIKVIYDCISDNFRAVSKHFNTIKPIILQIGTGKNKNLARAAEAIREMSCHLRIVGKLDHDQASQLRETNIEYSSVDNISDEKMPTIGKKLVTDMTAGISSAKPKLDEKLTLIKATMDTTFSSLSDDAFGWGESFMSRLIAGITSQMSYFNTVISNINIQMASLEFPVSSSSGGSNKTNITINITGNDFSNNSEMDESTVGNMVETGVTSALAKYNRTTVI